MTVGVVHFLFIGAFLFAAGAFVAARRRNFAAALVSVPLLLGGAGLDLVAADRFTASLHDPVGGQGFAIAVAVIALAFVGLGSGLARLETFR